MDIDTYLDKVVGIRQSYKKGIKPSLGLYQRLDLEAFTVLTIEIFTKRVTSSLHHLFCSFSLWQRFSYKDWLYVFQRFVAIHVQQAFAFETFLDFFYMFLQVDFITICADIGVEDKQMKQWILDGYVKAPGKLYLDRKYTAEQSPITYGLSYEDLFIVGQRLISEGAVKAEPINPEPHRELRGSVEVFWVQGPVPKSWHWAEKFQT